MYCPKICPSYNYIVFATRQRGHTKYCVKNIDVQHANYQIGERNIAVAERLLKEENINIIAQSTGGKKGRKILFNTITGEVLMSFINKNNSLKNVE